MNILDRKRKTTDKKVLGSFVAFIVFWISIAVYAYAVGDKTQILSDYAPAVSELFNVSRIFIAIGYVLLAGVYTSLIIVATRWISNFLQFSLCTLWIAPTLTISLAVAMPHFATVAMAIAILCSTALTCVIVSLEWFNLSKKILNESRRLIASFPKVTLFSLICCSFCMAITIFAITTHLCLNTIRDLDDTLPGYIVFFMIVNVLGYSWLFFFVFNLWTMTLSATVAIWLTMEMESKATLSNVFLRCLRLTSRYHLGTIAFSSSLFAPGSIHRMIIAHTIKRFKEGKVNVTFVLFALCNVFHPVVTNFTVHAAMMTSITNGIDFHASARKSFDYFVKYPRKCLIIVKSIESIIICLLSVTGFLLLLSFYCYRDFFSPRDDEDNKLNVVFAIFIGLGSTMFLGSLIAILYVTCITILLSLLEESEKSENNGKPCAMSTELRIALVVSGPPEWYRKLVCCRCLTRINTYTITNA